VEKVEQWGVGLCSFSAPSPTCRTHRDAEERGARKGAGPVGPAGPELMSAVQP